MPPKTLIYEDGSTVLRVWLDGELKHDEHGTRHSALGRRSREQTARCRVILAGAIPDKTLRSEKVVS
jgi:hypothetical protein